MRESITKAAFSALRWNYVGFAARSGSNFIIGIFLARLLGPKPFGQLAAAALVIGIANLLADAGFPSALIQAPSVTDLQIRFVFTMQFLIAIAMALGCGAVSGLVATVFHDPAVKGIILAISPIFVLQAFGQTASALLRRDLNFKALQSSQLVSYFVGYLVCGIPLALAGAGVWSLVAAQLVQAAVWAALLYLRVRHPVIPTFHASGVALLRFGAKVTASNIANYGISNSDNFFVGRTFGSLPLGFYNRAFTLGNAPLDGIVGTVQQVLFASCSRAEGRLAPIRRAYLCSLAAMAFVILPVFWTVGASAPIVMVGLYGEQWRPAAALFQPLAFALSIHALMAMAGPVLSSLNLVQREVNAQILTLTIALFAFERAIHVSLLALCWAVCGVYLFRFFVMTRAVLQSLHLLWRNVARVLIGPTFVGVSTAAVAWFAGRSAQAAHMAASRELGLVCLSMVVSASALVIVAGRWMVGAELAEVLHRGAVQVPQRMRWLVLGPEPQGGPVHDALTQDGVMASPTEIAVVKSTKAEGTV